MQRGKLIIVQTPFLAFFFCRIAAHPMWLRGWLMLVSMMLLLLPPKSQAVTTPSFDLIFQQHNVVMLLIDPKNGDIVKANPAAERFYGYSTTQLEAMTIEQINTFSAEQVEKERLAALAQDRHYFIFRHRLANDELRTVEVYSHPYRFQDRALLLSIVQDITPGKHRVEDLLYYQKQLESLVEAQKQDLEKAQHALTWILVIGLILQTLLIVYLFVALKQRNRVQKQYQQSASALHDIMDAATDLAIIATDIHGTISAYNKGAENLLGYTEQEVVGRMTPLQFHKMDQMIQRGVIESVKEADFQEVTHHLMAFNKRHNEWLYVHQSGREVPVSLNVKPIFDEAQQLVGYLGVAQDITALKASQQALFKTQNHLKATLDALPDLLFESDMEGTILSFHTSDYTKLYVPPKAFLGKKVTQVLPPEPAETILKALSQARQTGASKGYQYALEIGGETLYFELSVAMKESEGIEPVFVFLARDVTERKRQEQVLLDSEARLSLAMTAAQMGLWDWNVLTGDVLWDDRCFEMLGYPKQGFKPHFSQWRDLLYYKDFKASARKLQAFLAQDQQFMLEFRLKSAQPGERLWVEARGKAVEWDEHGSPVRVVGTLLNIQRRKEAEAKLNLAASVFVHASEGIIITDRKGQIVDVNQGFTDITGYTREEVLGHNPSLLNSGRQPKAFYEAMWQELQAKGHWVGEMWNRHKDGSVYAQLLTINEIKDKQGRTVNYLGMSYDITAHKEQQKQLEHIAHYDVLTQLPNRVLLSDRLNQAMITCQRHQCSLAVVFIDLDGFKAVNDQYGHDVGDLLLIQIAKRMKSVMREQDTLSRIGGDEFVAVLSDIYDKQDSLSILNRLLAQASEPNDINGTLLTLSASIGVTFYPEDQVDADQLMRHADQAMYLAKQDGKNRFRCFDVEYSHWMKVQSELISELEIGLAQNQFELQYQPKVNLKAHKVIGAEALIRWHHPQKGLLMPGAFLPDIKDHALSIRLDDWVLDQAMAQLTMWHQAGLRVKVSVNISPLSLQQDAFVEKLRNLQTRYPQVPPQSLEIEILESSALDDLAHVSDVITQCAQIGVRFAIDDFGTGYSSLTYLRHLPAQWIKIDQSFVRDMLQDADDRAIVDGILKMAQAFHRDVLAEGAETALHLQALQQMGCENAQGYGIAKPMSASALPDWVRDWEAFQ